MATPKTPRKSTGPANKPTKGAEPSSAKATKPDASVKTNDKIEDAVVVSEDKASASKPDATKPEQKPTAAETAKSPFEGPVNAQVKTGQDATKSADRADSSKAEPSKPATSSSDSTAKPTPASPASSAKSDPPKPDAAKAEASQAKPTPPAPLPTATKSGPGFLPLVLGGVVAAGIGFGLAQIVPDGWPGPSPTPLQEQVTQQAGYIESLRDRLEVLTSEEGNQALTEELTAIKNTATAALETAVAAQIAAENPDSGTDLSPRLTELEGSLAELSDRMTALEDRPTEAGTGVDPAVITRLNTTLADLKAEIDDLRQQFTEQTAASEARVQEAEAARDEVAAQSETALLQAAMAKVEAALQSGAPFNEDLAQLSDAGIETPAVLTDNAESGVPTLRELSLTFDDPARKALEESLRGNMGSTWAERAGSFLRSQTGARSLTPRDGDDPDAVLSRAGAAVDDGDLTTALSEIETLPEAAQAAMSEWVARAKLRLDAQAAAADLSTALSER